MLYEVITHRKVFTKTEQNYTTTEREALAILHAIDKYSNMLLGTKEINVYTDHKSLIALLQAQSPTKGRLARWRIEFASYNFV